MMPPERLKEIEERAEAASPGPWKNVILQKYNRIMSVDGKYILEKDYGTARIRDGEFIAHARQDIPDLIAEFRRLQEERDRAIGWRDHDNTKLIDINAENEKMEEELAILNEIAEENETDYDPISKRFFCSICELTHRGESKPHVNDCLYTRLKKLREGRVG